MCPSQFWSVLTCDLHFNFSLSMSVVFTLSSIKKCDLTGPVLWGVSVIFWCVNRFVCRHAHLCCACFCPVISLWPFRLWKSFRVGVRTRSMFWGVDNVTAGPPDYRSVCVCVCAARCLGLCLFLAVRREIIQRDHRAARWARLWQRRRILLLLLPSVTGGYETCTVNTGGS